MACRGTDHVSVGRQGVDVSAVSLLHAISEETVDRIMSANLECYPIMKKQIRTFRPVGNDQTQKACKRRRASFGRSRKEIRRTVCANGRSQARKTACFDRYCQMTASSIQASTLCSVSRGHARVHLPRIHPASRGATNKASSRRQ